MAPFAPWSSIPPEVLLLISGGFRHLESYCRARGVCTEWRAALPPPIPSLVTITAPPGTPLHRHDQDVMSVVFLPVERSYPLTTLSRGSRCVGSRDGWLAVDSRRPCSMGIYLVNRLAGGKHVLLLHLHNDGNPVPKVVFAPEPTQEDYVAVAICDLRRLAYTKTRDMKWMILDVVIGERDRFIDLAYDTDAGKVYCVTLLGDVHVLHLPQRQRRRPIVEPLQAERTGLPFDPADAYAAPYDTASKFTDVKNIFFFGGNLYQVWNTSSAVSFTMPDGSQFDMAKHNIFVLKYDPQRRPCWDAVKDLGGYSVFVGKNQPVVLRPEDAPGVRGNCVYWINELSRNEPMVFDMATGTSTLHPSADKALDPSCRPVCWYFLNDKIMKMSVEGNGRKRCRSGEDRGQVSKSRKAH